MELAQQIKADFEESFQGPNAKVRSFQLIFLYILYLSGMNKLSFTQGHVMIKYCLNSPLSVIVSYLIDANCQIGSILSF